MHTRKTSLLAVCLAILAPATGGAASAATSDTGPYFAAGIGLASMRDSEITDSTVPGVTAVLNADRGMAVDVALGYDFGATRAEAEIVYQKSDLDALDFGLASLTVAGDVSTFGVMFNGYYEFDAGEAVSPFVTAGVGLAKVEIGDFSVPATGLPPVSDDDTEAAYQFGAGVGVQVSESVSVDFTYRYFATADLKFDTTRAEFSSHRFTVGLRVEF